MGCVNMNNEILKIDIKDIIPNTYQPRKYFNDEALIELSESIKTHGIIQPITVRKRGEFYELVAGERRWRAAKLAELKEVPCNIIDITDVQSAEIALLENLQREDLNFIEEAEAYYNLIHDHRFTQEQLATRMGKKQSTIANKLRILKLSEKVRELCVANNVRQTEELINKELLKLAGKELNGKNKKKITTVFPAKLYVNTIKQVFDKFNIPAKYKMEDHEEYIQVTVNIPKNKK